jgi:uncharacterized membrane protein
MQRKHAAALSGVGVVAMVAASAVVGPRLPDTMVTHWNAAGEPDGRMAKVWGQFMVPLVTAGVVALLFAAPSIDPNSEAYDAFRDIYHEFVVVLTAFLALTHGVVLAVNLGYDVPVSTTIYAGVGLLVIFTGFVLERAEQNWFVGIRTPWTLEDEAVWQRTHEVGGTLFKLAGLVAVVGAFVPWNAMALVVGPVVVSALGLVVYSYYRYTRRDGEPTNGT